MAVIIFYGRTSGTRMEFLFQKYGFRIAYDTTSSKGAKLSSVSWCGLDVETSKVKRAGFYQKQAITVGEADRAIGIPFKSSEYA